MWKTNALFFTKDFEVDQMEKLEKKRFFSDEQNYFELVKKREVLFFQLEEH